LSEAALVGVLIALCGCGSPVMSSRPEARIIGSGRYDLIPALDVPRVRGPDGCGSQALAAVMAHRDRAIDATALAEDLPWHEAGATPVDLLLEARARGWRATVVRGDWDRLAELVREGTPGLVMIDIGYTVRTIAGRLPTSTVMHWAIVSGMAIDGSTVLLAAPDARHHESDRADFIRRWERSDCCLVVVD
jgi:predicted double-glycine peptidase